MVDHHGEQNLDPLNLSFANCIIQKSHISEINNELFKTSVIYLQVIIFSFELKEVAFTLAQK